MKLSIFLLLLLAQFISHRAFACSPAVNFNPPKLKDNFQRAQKVVFGTVKNNQSLADGSFKIVFQVEKVWKGAKSSQLTVSANRGSTCDPFGANAVVGAGCVLFLGSENKVISGVNSGESSFCIDPGVPRLKTIIAEYDGRFAARDDESECISRGGRWEGIEHGRGRLTGCNLPTKDGGKKCTKAEDCESVCLGSGECHGWQKYKGCGYFHGREGMMCVD